MFRLVRDRVQGGNGSICFSPDSKLLALRLDQLGRVRLLATGSWEEMATIEEGSPLCFSADGAKLAAYSEETKMLMVWDLRLVRRELAALGLVPVEGGGGKPPARVSRRKAATVKP